MSTKAYIQNKVDILGNVKITCMNARSLNMHEDRTQDSDYM